MMAGLKNYLFNYLYELINGKRVGILAFPLKAGLRFLSWIYACFIFFRNFFYDFNLLKSREFSPAVLSLGNITTGGTGKTPAAATLAAYFQEQGKRVAVISRGYQGENFKPLLISDGSQILAGPGLAGDEAYMLARKLNDTPVVICRDKIEAARFACQELKPEILLVDDGYQHRRLTRDFDLVLIDATNPFGYNFLLPRGLLREPKSALKRADGIVISRSDLVSRKKIEDIVSRIQNFFDSDFIYLSRHIPFGLQSFQGERLDLISLENSRVVAFSGLANPAGFLASLEELGSEVVRHFEFPDHHNYSREDLKRIVNFFLQRDNIDFLITTRKDMVKFNQQMIDFLKIKNIDPLRLEIKMEFSSFFPEVESFESRLEQALSRKRGE